MPYLRFYNSTKKTFWLAFVILLLPIYGRASLVFAAKNPAPYSKHNQYQRQNSTAATAMAPDQASTSTPPESNLAASTDPTADPATQPQQNVSEPTLTMPQVADPASTATPATDMPTSAQLIEATSTSTELAFNLPTPSAVYRSVIKNISPVQASSQASSPLLLNTWEPFGGSQIYEYNPLNKKTSSELYSLAAVLLAGGTLLALRKNSAMN